MKRAVAALLILLSLACIISAAVEVVMGEAGLWSAKALGSYLFHVLTMLGALVLIAGKPKQDPAVEADS